MTLGTRLTLTMIGLVALTAMVIFCLTYRYVDASVVVSELTTAAAIMVLAAGFARAATWPQASVAEVIRSLVGDPTPVEPNAVSVKVERPPRAFRGTREVMHEKFAASVRRLSEQQHSDKLLAEARACIAIVRSTSHPIAGYKTDGTITDWNPAAVKLYQYTAEEAIGNNIAIIVPPDRANEHAAIIAKAIEVGQIENFETVRVAKNGRRIDVSLSLSSFNLPSGDTVCATIARDITDEKLIEDKFRLAFESCSCGMIMVGGGGRIAIVNSEAERMFGYTREALIGEPIEILIPARLIDRRGPNSGELILPGTGNFQPNANLFGRRRDGTEFPIEINLKSIRNDETYVGLCVVVDITERKRLVRLKDEFVSTVSHELRTPMTSIFASLSLLTSGAAGKMPDAAARLLTIGRANCERLVRLINNILDVQKLESGQAAFKLERVNVRFLIENAIDATRGFARDYGISLRLDATAQDAEACADSDRLIQVVTNLLSNAIKFSPTDTEVMIGIERREETFVISVRDHGHGIPDEFKKRIFEKFAQADATDSREKSGTGLGLSIVREIVEQLGGQVSFQDAPNGGTIFYVELPYWGSHIIPEREVASLFRSGQLEALADKMEQM